MSANVSGALSAGAQFLANDRPLLPGSSQPDIGSATPDSSVRKAANIAPVQTGSTLSGSITSADGDTVELSAEALQMLQQMGEGGSFDVGPSHSAQTFSAAAAYEGFDYFG